MKQIFKKSRMLVLLITLLVLTLSGCNSNNTNKENKGNTQSATPKVTMTPEASIAPKTSVTPEVSKEAVMKSVTVEVVNDKGESKVYDIKSDAATLYDAIKATEGLTLEGNVGDYGFYITAVNGVTADFDKDKAYWAFYVNGEYGQTSVDTQPIANGDTFKLVYEVSKSE